MDVEEDDGVDSNPGPSPLPNAPFQKPVSFTRRQGTLTHGAGGAMGAGGAHPRQRPAVWGSPPVDSPCTQALSPARLFSDF